MMMDIILNDWFLFALSLVIFSHSLTCDLVFDDTSAIVKNADLRWNETSIIDLFGHDYWGSPIDSDVSHKSYRPLTVLTFRSNFLLHEVSPLGYHAVNIVLHAVVVLLTRRLCQQLIFPSSTSFSSKKSSTTSSQRLYSFLAALLFAVHPIHTEAVVGVVGRAELLCAIFLIMAILFYYKNYVFLSLLSTALAFLSKEQGITVIAIFIVIELCSQNLSIPNSKQINRILCLTLFGLGLLVSRVWIMGGSDSFPVFTKFDNPASYSDFPTRHLTYNYLIAFNAFLLLYPLNLCCDWTMKSIDLVTTVCDNRNLATIFLYLLLCKLLLLGVRSSMKGHHPLLTSISLMIFPFIPSTNLLVPVGFVVAERILYIPSIGYSCIIILGMKCIRESRGKRYLKKILLPLFLVTVLALTLKTVGRTLEWKDEQSLFESGIKVNPRNAKLFNNLGHVYEKRANWTMAMTYFRKAVDLQPDDLGTVINVARTHLNSGDAAKSEELLWYLRPKILTAAKKNKRIPPNYLHLWINLGNILSSNSSRLTEAEQVYLELISLREDYVDAYINLGDVYIKLGKVLDAINVYNKALSLPKSGKEGDLLYNLGVAHSLLLEDHLKQQDSSSVVQDVKTIAGYFLKSLVIVPKNRDALLNLAILIQNNPKILREEKPIVMQIMKTYDGPERERILFNLALMFADEGDRKTAEHFLKNTLEIKPDFASALFNLALIVNQDNRPFEAQSYLQQLLAVKPDHVKGLALDIEISGSFKQTDRVTESWNKLLSLKETIPFVLPQESLTRVCLVVSKVVDLKTSKDHCKTLLTRPL